jgi:hypothetical protein
VRVLFLICTLHDILYQALVELRRDELTSLTLLVMG